MDTKFIVFIVIASFALIFLGAMLETVGWWTNGSQTIYNESITFPTNATYVKTQYTPINTITAVYNLSTGAKTCAYSTAYYTFDAINGIMMYQNGTADTNCTYVGSANANEVTYTVLSPTGLGGVLMGFITAIMVLVVLLKLFNYI